MKNILEDFFKSLRHHDIEVGISSEIDALNAVSLINLENKSHLKKVLKATLLKNTINEYLFNKVFDAFFTLNEVEIGAIKEDNSIVYVNLIEVMNRGDLTTLNKLIQEVGRQKGFRKFSSFLQKGNYKIEIMNEIGIKTLDYHILNLKKNKTSLQDENIIKDYENKREKIFSIVGNWVDQQYKLHGEMSAKHLHIDVLYTRDLKKIDQRDALLIKELIVKMVKKLAFKKSSIKRTKKINNIDIPRTIHANVANDGILFNLHWMRNKIDKTKIIIICDVSNSVRIYSSFLLLIVYLLQKIVSNLDAYAFSDRLININNFLISASSEEAMNNIMNSIAKNGTNYGQMFADFESKLPSLTRNTTILILGDARNNGGDANARILCEAQKICKKIIWLNPEPKNLWKFGDSNMKNYSKYCTKVFECNTLEHLDNLIEII